MGNLVEFEKIRKTKHIDEYDFHKFKTQQRKKRALSVRVRHAQKIGA